jgi:hypothetical protein
MSIVFRFASDRGQRSMAATATAAADAATAASSTFYGAGLSSVAQRIIGGATFCRVALNVFSAAAGFARGIGRQRTNDKNTSNEDAGDKYPSDFADGQRCIHGCPPNRKSNGRDISTKRGVSTPCNRHVRFVPIAGISHSWFQMKKEVQCQ